MHPDKCQHTELPREHAELEDNHPVLAALLEQTAHSTCTRPKLPRPHLTSAMGGSLAEGAAHKAADPGHNKLHRCIPRTTLSTCLLLLLDLLLGHEQCPGGVCCLPLANQERKKAAYFCVLLLPTPVCPTRLGLQPCCLWWSPASPCCSKSCHHFPAVLSLHSTLLPQLREPSSLLPYL
jgi:hypothetical protein